MENKKWTLISGFVALLIGASCCWLSSLAVWIGGASLFGAIATYTESVQIPMIVIGILLLLLGFYKYQKSRKNEV